MILLDTHILVLYIHQDKKLSDAYRRFIDKHLNNNNVAVSIITCWEIAKLVQLSRIEVTIALNEWFEKVFNENNITLLDLNFEIIIDSTNLPGEFHRDPFDQIIVATARIHNCELVTFDKDILAYPHVKKFTP